MNTTFVTDLVKNINNAIINTYAEMLANDIDDGHQQGRDTIDIIKESLTKILNELPKASSPSTVVTTNTCVSTPSTPKKAVSADVLKDGSGQPIRCCATTKSSGAPCKNNAKFLVGDKHLCGLHAKSAQPDANSKPVVGNSPSSFGAIVNSKPSHSYASIDIDTNNIPDIL